MNSLTILLVFAVGFAGIGVADADPVAQHRICFDNNSTDTDVCIKNVLDDYEFFYNNHLRQMDNLRDHSDWLSAALNAMDEDHLNKTKILEAEVQLWKNKYNYVISQHGNVTIQDQIANLTARVDAVETQTERNESHIYIIQNMLRTVQTDIESIWLKINSVR